MGWWYLITSFSPTIPLYFRLHSNEMHAGRHKGAAAVPSSHAPPTLKVLRQRPSGWPHRSFQGNEPAAWTLARFLDLWILGVFRLESLGCQDYLGKLGRICAFLPSSSPPLPSTPSIQRRPSTQEKQGGPAGRSLEGCLGMETCTDLRQSLKIGRVPFPSLTARRPYLQSASYNT